MKKEKIILDAFFEEFEKQAGIFTRKNPWGQAHSLQQKEFENSTRKIRNVEDAYRYYTRNSKGLGETEKEQLMQHLLKKENLTKTDLNRWEILAMKQNEKALKPGMTLGTFGGAFGAGTGALLKGKKGAAIGALLGTVPGIIAGSNLRRKSENQARKGNSYLASTRGLKIRPR